MSAPASAEAGSETAAARSRGTTSGPRTVLRRVLPQVAVGLLAALVFTPTVGFGFLPWDDLTILSTNPRFRGDRSSAIAWIVTTQVLGHWIPLTWASLALDVEIWGRNAAGYHLTNVGLHALNAVVFYGLARRLLARALVAEAANLDIGAGVAALTFALHPLRVESVAWVTERRDVLSGLFFLLSVLAYLHAAEAPGGASRRGLACSLLSFVAALLSKQITMTLPAVLVILDAYPLRRLSRPGVLREKAPFVLLGAAGAAVAALGQHADIGFTGLGRLDLGERLAIVAHGLAYYPAATLLPAWVSPLHELPARVEALGPRFLASGATALGITAAALVFRRRAPWLGAAWAYSVVMILPVSGLAHVSTILVADRYSYLSTMSWAVVLGGALAALVRTRRRGLVPAGLAAAALALAAWGYLTHAYASVWASPESLWRHAVDVDPACAQCRGHLGLALAARGLLAQAEDECARSVALRPDRADHHAFLASVLERRGRLDAAAAAWARAARLHPRYRPQVARVKGLALVADGRLAAAVVELRRAHEAAPAAARPHLVRALNALAVERAAAGDPAGAGQALGEALRLEPDNPVVRANLAELRRARGDAREAVGPR